MAADDRFAQAWSEIPDPIARAPVSAVRPMAAPRVPSPTRSATQTRRWVALAAMCAWPPLLRLGWGLRPDIDERMSFVVAQSALFGLLALAIVALALGRGRRGLGGSVSRTRAAAVIAPIFFMLVGLVWLPASSPSSFGEVGPASAVLPCILLGLLVAIPMLLVVISAVRRAFPSAAGWRGAALGAGLGLVGSVALTAHCPSPFGGHVAIAHGLPIVIAVLAGALLGSKVAKA
jgi:hypothetical protein